MPKVFVLLSSFNHAKFIREAIDSVLRQTFADFEFVILDDASTDESWRIIESYADPRIKAIRNSKNGEMGMVDIISNVAADKYIAIHHSDDVWELDKLEKQIPILDGAPEICAVFTNACLITEEGTPHHYSNIFDQPNRSRHEWLRYLYSYGNALCHPSALIRKRCFDECGYYSPRLRQLPDYEMWIRFALKYEIHVIPEKLTRFRVRSRPETQMSGNSRASRIRSAFEMFHVMDTYRGIPSFDDLYKIFPEARKYHRTDGGDLYFVLGLVMLELATNPPIQLFALELVHEALEDPVRAQNIRSVYGFDPTDMIRHTGSYDVFSLEEVGILRETLQEHREQIQESNAKFSEQLANTQIAIGERDARIAQLKLESQERYARISELENSTSWRLTAPLRAASRKLRRL